jgi:hypothetical protein
MFLKGKYPGCPRLSFPCVDVRDVARMHRLALETEAACVIQAMSVHGFAACRSSISGHAGREFHAMSVQRFMACQSSS